MKSGRCYMDTLWNRWLNCVHCILDGVKRCAHRANNRTVSDCQSRSRIMFYLCALIFRLYIAIKIKKDKTQKYIHDISFTLDKYTNFIVREIDLILRLYRTKRCFLNESNWRNANTRRQPDRRTESAFSSSSSILHEKQNENCDQNRITDRILCGFSLLPVCTELNLSV